MTVRTFPWWMRTAVVVATVSVATPGAQAQQAGVAPAGDERGPLERRAVAITLQNPIPKRTAMIAALYPPDEPNRTLRGTVTLRVTLDALGHVAEARQAYRPDPSMIPNNDGSVQSGPPLPSPFVKAALDAVRAWQYELPAQAPISFYVRLHFVPDQPASVIWHDARAPLTATTLSGGRPGVVAGTTGTTTPSPPAPGGALGGTTVLTPSAPVRVGGNVSAPVKIRDVPPVYPLEAQKARIQGLVIIEATIAADGRVVDARVLRSVPQLDQAALDAVRQWEYTPTLLNGTPVPIIMSVTVNFVLSSPPVPAAPQ